LHELHEIWYLVVIIFDVCKKGFFEGIALPIPYACMQGVEVFFLTTEQDENMYVWVSITSPL